MLILAADGVSRCEQRIWRLSDGRIDGELTCPPDRAGPPNAVAIAMTVTGSYTRDSFDAEGNAQVAMIGFRQKVAAKRVGDCTGDERP